MCRCAKSLPVRSPFPCELVLRGKLRWDQAVIGRQAKHTLQTLAHRSCILAARCNDSSTSHVSTTVYSCGFIILMYLLG